MLIVLSLVLIANFKLSHFLIILFQCEKSSKCIITKKAMQSCNSSTGSHHNCGDHNFNTSLVSMESCHSCQQTCSSSSLPRSSTHSVSPLKSISVNGGSMCVDNGYSSCGENCDCSSSMPSSNDGSDIACSEGVCSGGLDGEYTWLVTIFFYNHRHIHNL